LNFAKQERSGSCPRKSLLFEISRTPDPLRRTYAKEVLAKAAVQVHTNDAVEELARALHEQGIRPLDALHLASAVHGKADFFCTCDDKLLRRARSADIAPAKAVSPLELIQEMDPWLSR
jgi:predicted nucleic acid-binding protein